MNPNEEQFDDFKVPEASAYVNETIGRRTHRGRAVQGRP